MEDRRDEEHESQAQGPEDGSPDLVTQWREHADRLHERANQLGNCRAGLELATEAGVWRQAASQLEAAGRDPASDGDAYKPWPFGNTPVDRVTAEDLRGFLAEQCISFSPEDSRAALLVTLAGADFAVPVVTAAQSPEDIVDPDSCPACAAAKDDPTVPPLPKPWPFSDGPQTVRLDAVRHWLWEQKYETAGDLVRNPGDRSRHLAALREAGVQFPDYRDTPDLPEFVHTLMEATDADLDEALDNIGADGRARLLRILARKPKPVIWVQDEAQELFTPGFRPGEHETSWHLGPLVMGRGTGKSSLAAQIGAEYAALHGPDTADWLVEVVTRHHFSGVTAERASVDAVRAARTGSGEVREVLTRREKPGRP